MRRRSTERLGHAAVRFDQGGHNINRLAVHYRVSGAILHAGSVAPVLFDDVARLAGRYREPGTRFRMRRPRFS